MSDLDAVLDRLTRLHPRAIDLSLDRIRHLMGRLGDPQDRLPPVIHVAGTNGKGSTIAILRATFEAAGYAAHVYTSPHLVRFNERIRLAGKLIEDGALVALLDEIERCNDGTLITFFEITTAAAFLAFARMPADVVLLETGLGGRLDATNLIAAPAVSIITPIGMDHMNWFGDRLALIAAEKAGILKPGRPAVFGSQPDEAAAVLEARAVELGVPVYRCGRDWQATETAVGWRYNGTQWRFELPRPNLAGLHQIENAGTALAALERLAGFTFDAATLAEAMGRIEWPARLQRLTLGPLRAALPPQHELWLDGAHNAHAGAMLARHVKAQWDDRPLVMIFGGLTTRDPADVLRDLAPHVARLFGVAIDGAAASHDAAAVAAAGAGLGIPSEAGSSVAAAIARIETSATGPVRVLICGSLYLAGQVLTQNG